jgi:hypothetical protein
VVFDLTTEFPSTYIVVTYHPNEAPFTQWETDRVAFYDVLATGYPWMAYDGLFDAWPISNYRPSFIARQAVPTDVTIDLSGVEVTDRTWDFTAEVCLEPGGVAKTLDLFMVEVLDHWPTGQSYYRNGFLQVADPEVVALSADSCVLVTRQFVFAEDPSWNNREDISIVAWVQEMATTSPAEVHQATQLDYPFNNVSPPFHEDGFESGDFTQWANATP